MRSHRVGLLTLVLGAVISGLASVAPGPAVAAPAPATTSPCPGLEVIAIDGVDECTHGGDLAPPVAPMARVRARAIPAPPCPGDGRSGPRIRVVLGVPRNTASPDGSAARSRIRHALGLADANLDAASTEVGQHYRFFCATDGPVTITTVSLPAIGKDRSYAFDDVVAGLTTHGFTKSSAIYAVFVANIDCCYTYGGQGSLMGDDTPSPSTNRNNGSFARYSMIRLSDTFDTPTLALVFQHETGHNMGAVQNSAPHSSGAYHCYETNDIMCYEDGGPYFTGGGALVSVCPDPSAVGMYVFDCGGDDYYNTAPAPNTYLADHWNVADSRWLTPIGATGQ
jgi:hypothetical protein